MITLNGKRYNTLIEGVVLEVEKFNPEWLDAKKPKPEKEIINITPETKQLPWHIRKELVSEIEGQHEN